MNKFAIFTLALLFAIPAFALVQDDFVINTLSDRSVEKPEVISNYNYEDTDIVPIRLQITQKIKSEKDLYEGQTIGFTVYDNVFYKGQLLVKQGTPVTSRVETIITNGMNGIPASVIISDFNIPSLDKNKISPPYEKFGLDLSLLVFPVKWALTILPPTGSLTNFIKGGHVRITERTPVIIYYHPNWNQ